MLIQVSTPQGWSEPIDMSEEVALARLNGGTARIVDEEVREVAIIQHVVHKAAKFIPNKRYAGVIAAKNAKVPSSTSARQKPMAAEVESPWKKTMKALGLMS